MSKGAKSGRERANKFPAADEASGRIKLSYRRLQKDVAKHFPKTKKISTPFDAEN